MNGSVGCMSREEIMAFAERFLMEEGIAGYRPEWAVRDLGLEEGPDIFGLSRRKSIQVRILTSYEELISHQRSNCAVMPETDCGQLRAYFCEEGVITPRMITGGWGLYVVTARGKVREDVRPANQQASLAREHEILSVVLDVCGMPRKKCISLSCLSY